MRASVIHVARSLGLEVRMTSVERPAQTAGAAAAAIGCHEAQIAKTQVFVADGEPVLCVASGSHPVDLDKLCDVLDSASARPAGPEEVRAATGFPPGSIPPFAHSLAVVLDEALLDHDRIWAAGGDCSTLFAVDPRELADRIGATVAGIGRG